MIKKILIILYLIIIAAIIYFAVDFFMARENDDNTNPADRAQKRVEKIFKNDTAKNDTRENDKESQQPNEKSIENNTSQENPPAYTITQADCNNECASLVDAKKTYCMQICGLSGTNSDVVSCEQKKGLDKDYCIRDEAVTNNNIKNCENIDDTGIKDQCIKRIQEEIMDEIM